MQRFQVVITGIFFLCASCCSLISPRQTEISQLSTYYCPESNLYLGERFDVGPAPGPNWAIWAGDSPISSNIGAERIEPLTYVDCSTGSLSCLELGDSSGKIARFYVELEAELAKPLQRGEEVFVLRVSPGSGASRVFDVFVKSMQREQLTWFSIEPRRGVAAFRGMTLGGIRESETCVRLSSIGLFLKLPEKSPEYEN